MERKEEPDSVVRHEEEIAGVEKRWRDAGSLRARKRVERERVREAVPVDVEHVELDRRRPADDDSGEIETLPDGSVSIPVYEEELVVTRRRVLKERVIVRKKTVAERAIVEDELRKERVDVDADEEIADRVEVDATSEPTTPAAVKGREHTAESGEPRRVIRAGEDERPWFDFDREHETKPFFVTSEFVAAVAAVAAIVVAAWVADDVDAALAWTLATVVAAAYLLSRGFAKAGTADPGRARRGR